MKEPSKTYVGLPCKICCNPVRYFATRTCTNCSEDPRVRAALWHKENRERHNKMMREGQLRRRFGLSPDGYRALAEAQGNACAICREKCVTGRVLAVDHCHSTGQVRGLLCNSCNLGLGKFKDDLSLVRAALDYLLSRSAANVNIRPVNDLQRTRKSKHL